MSEVPPEVLPWIAKICPKSGLPIPPPPPTPSGVTGPPPGDYGIQNLGGGAEDRLPNDLQCPKCQGPLFVDGGVCVCAPVSNPPPAWSVDTPISSPLGHGRGLHGSISLPQHNTWTLEEMQLFENTYGYLRHDGGGASLGLGVHDGLLLSAAPLTGGVDEGALLSLFDTSGMPNLNLTGRPSTHHGDDLTWSGSSSSTEVSSTASLPQLASREFGQPLLHVATQNGHCNIIQMLIDHRVDINERDATGTTALHIAVRKRHEGAVRLLFQHGADITADDGENQSPLFLAVRMGFEDAVRLFLSQRPGSRLDLDQGQYQRDAPWGGHRPHRSSEQSA
jgi:hypothetical protein